MRQGAVGQVRLVEYRGRHVVEKVFADAARQQAEISALTQLVDVDLPVPELIKISGRSILMTLMPGERLDSDSADLRIARLQASAVLLRHLHRSRRLQDLPPPPDDAMIIRRYRDAGGPPLPLVVPETGPPALCHGDWTDGNLLATGTTITAVIDWEAAHVGDPLRELSRAAWGASLKDSRSIDALVAGYGADPTQVRAWFPVHAAELWLWFNDAGPPEYLRQLTARLAQWPDQ